MENNSHVYNSYLSTAFSPKWKSGTHFFKPGHSMPPKSSSISYKNPPFKSNELDRYKKKASKGFNSPIIRAYNNIDEFYRSIKPDIGLSKKSLNDSASHERPEVMLSFYSKKSSEVDDRLSSIVNSEQLGQLTQSLNQETYKQEDEMYQEALKNLCDKLCGILNKEKIEVGKEEIINSEENSFEY